MQKSLNYRRQITVRSKRVITAILSILFITSVNPTVNRAEISEKSNVQIEYITNFNDVYTPIGEGFFYTYNNGSLIIDEYGNYLFSPGEYDYPYSDSEMNLRAFTDTKWCRAYKDKFVVINSNKEMTVIDGTGKQLTDFSDKGYTIYNENYAFDGIIRNTDEIDKIIDLSNGKYVTDESIINEIKNGNLPENQFGNYEYEYGCTNIDPVNYIPDLPAGYYPYKSYSVPNGDRIVTIVSTDKYPDFSFIDSINKDTFSALYCNGEFITQPDSVEIKPIFEANAFLIYNYKTKLSDIVDSYGNILFKNQEKCHILGNNIVQTDKGLIRIKGSENITPTEDSRSTDKKNYDINCSKWAEEEIINAIENNIVPPELQENYTDKITRGDFCKLAVYTILAYENTSPEEYFAHSDKEFNYISGHKKFTDTGDDYIKFAVDIGVASGISENQFAPCSYITRQEAAVMVSNTANILGIESNYDTSNKFIDESYFADWAKESIYRVSDINVMSGTEPDKFSPWMNYTREQAIATMWRLYNCGNKESVT